MKNAELSITVFGKTNASLPPTLKYLSAKKRKGNAAPAFKGDMLIGKNILPLPTYFSNNSRFFSF